MEKRKNRRLFNVRRMEQNKKHPQRLLQHKENGKFEEVKVIFVFPAFFKERLFYADLLLTVVFNLINTQLQVLPVIPPPPSSVYHLSKHRAMY
jgi:hypothetical protein